MTSRPRDPSRIPVRGAIGIGVTAAGMAFLLSLRPPAAGGDFALALDTTTTDDTGSVAAEIVAASPTAVVSASPSASATACVTASPDPSASASPTASASATTSTDCVTASPSPTAEATATATATVTPEATGLTGTATGDEVSFRFGTVQVQVSVVDGVITEVVALQLPDGDRRSASISSQVESWLAEEAITAQSSDIDIISGATYTSRAYAQSLQSALDRLAA